VANLIVIGLIIWGIRNGDDDAPGAPPAVEASRPAHPRPPPLRIEKRPLERQVAARPPVAAQVAITAVRGNCWISARRGTSTGPVLVEKTLLQGDIVTVHARRVWLELGAAGNVDVTLNGRARPIRSGTTEIVLG
jgi:hypothetical protein